MTDVALWQSVNDQFSSKLSDICTQAREDPDPDNVSAFKCSIWCQANTLLVGSIGIGNLYSSDQLWTGPHQSYRPSVYRQSCQAKDTYSAIHQQYWILSRDSRVLWDLAKATYWCPDRCICISSCNWNLHPSHGHGKDCKAKWRNTIRADSGNFKSCWSSQDRNGQISQGSPYTWTGRELSTLCQSCGQTWLARREMQDAGRGYGPQRFWMKWCTCFVYVCKLQCAYLQPS